MLGPLKIFFPRMTELGPQSPIGAMPCDPDRLRSGLQPDGYLRIGIALRIPRQEAALAGGHARQHSRNVRRGARGAVGLEPALLGIGRELLPFAHAALPLLGNSMPERLPEVGQGVVEGGPVAKDLEQGGIDQGLGIQGVEVIPGTQVCTAGGLLLRGKPLEPEVHPGGCRGGEHRGCVCGAHGMSSLVVAVTEPLHARDRRVLYYAVRLCVGCWRGL